MRSEESHKPFRLALLTAKNIVHTERSSSHSFLEKASTAARSRERTGADPCWWRKISRDLSNCHTHREAKNWSEPRSVRNYLIISTHRARRRHGIIMKLRAWRFSFSSVSFAIQPQRTHLRHATFSFYSLWPFFLFCSFCIFCCSATWDRRLRQYNESHSS